MKIRIIKSVIALVVFMMIVPTMSSLADPTPAPAATPPTGPDAKEVDTVADAPYAIDIQSVGTVEVYKSINGNRYYIAPQLQFALLDDAASVARLSGITAGNKRECELSVLMLAPNVREAVATRLTELTGATVKVENVGNLRVYAVIVGLNSDDVAKTFKWKAFESTIPLILRRLM